MRNKDNKHLGLEIEPTLHSKIKYIAKYEGRSINGQILYLIRKCIQQFEAENGEISVTRIIRTTLNREILKNKI